MVLLLRKPEVGYNMLFPYIVYCQEFHRSIFCLFDYFSIFSPTLFQHKRCMSWSVPHPTVACDLMKYISPRYDRRCWLMAYIATDICIKSAAKLKVSSSRVQEWSREEEKRQTLSPRSHHSNRDQLFPPSVSYLLNTVLWLLLLFLLFLCLFALAYFFSITERLMTSMVTSHLTEGTDFKPDVHF